MINLSEKLAQDKILLAPGIYDGLSALIAQQAGAEALYLSGAAIAYTRLGRPDLGLTTASEVCETLGAICDRVDIPVIVDGDTGFGNALNVERTVRIFERAGASAIQLEDQSFPKRCGHLSGKSLIGAREMTGKIRAACAARRDMLIIARTDAIAVEGFEAALERARAYANAGADMLFVEAPQSLAQMRRLVEELAPLAPLMANMVEGGRTPLQSADELQTLGYRLAIFPGGAARAIAKSLQDYYASLLAHGATAPYRAHMLDFDGLNRLIGAPELMARAKAHEEGDA